MVGVLEGLPKSGIFTSPNYPLNYPNSHDSTQTIQVAEGNAIWIRFITFECERFYDTVTITDKNGTTLGRFDGEPKGPKKIVYNTDTVEVRFHTDESATLQGWRLEWGEYKVAGIFSF